MIVKKSKLFIGCNKVNRRRSKKTLGKGKLLVANQLNEKYANLLCSKKNNYMPIVL